MTRYVPEQAGKLQDAHARLDDLRARLGPTPDFAALANYINHYHAYVRLIATIKDSTGADGVIVKILDQLDTQRARDPDELTRLLAITGRQLRRYVDRLRQLGHQIQFRYIFPRGYLLEDDGPVPRPPGLGGAQG